MNSEYYQYNKDDLERFRNSLNAKVKINGSEMVFMHCPYCLSGKGNKDKWTFSVSTETGQFECKRASCGVRGNMITLAKDFSDRFKLSKDVTSYYNINGQGNKFNKFKDGRREIEVREPAVKYLLGRGIPEEVTKRYEITSMPDQDNILCFPFKNENGELDFIKYRNTEFNKEKGGNKEWCIKGNYKKILFGMKQCEDFGTLVITEGQIDSLSCAAAGIKNAVSVPTGKNGFTWKPNVWNWLVKFDEIVVFGDREGSEITLAKEISQFFPKTVRIVRVQDYQGCKDANELLQKYGAEALQNAVKNAKAQVSLRIRNLADVEMVDYNKIPAYPTGIDSLDNAIGRGFHDGELVILTGKAGEGKSTFASQIVAKMIKNGLSVFCYSGELPAPMFRAWIDKQICLGTVTEGARNKAGAWYNEKLWIYDDSFVADEKEEIFDLIAQAVKLLGCKFILIDNLMTAMEDKPSEDLYRQQSTFVTKLTKYAKSFNVIIMLVAHPKKGDSDSNDSISGSGDVTNRASIVLRYQRKPHKKRKDENDVEAEVQGRQDDISLIKITKNRTTGKLNWDGIEVMYEDDSMRIHEPGTEIENFINLDPEDEFYQADDLDDIPF